MANPVVDVQAKYEDDLNFYYPDRTFDEVQVNDVWFLEWDEPISVVDSVSDGGSGQARFTYSDPILLTVGQAIENTGFGDSNYNVSGQVSVTDGTTYYELDSAPVFTATGVGDFEATVSTSQAGTLAAAYKDLREHEFGFVVDELMLPKAETAIGSGNIVQIDTAAQFEALAVAGVITIAVDTTLLFRNTVDIVTSSVIVVTGGDLMLTANYIEGATLDYSGTGTFITSLLGNDVRVRGRLRLESSSTGTLIDMVGPLVAFEVIDSTIQGWDDLGTARECAVTFKSINFVFISGSLVAIDSTVIIDSILLFGVSTQFINFTHEQITGRGAQATISGVLSLDSTATSLFRIDPAQDDRSRFSFSLTDTGDEAIPVFLTGDGSTGTFSAAANAVIATTSITSVSGTVGGPSTFNFTPGPTLFIGQTVNHTSFTESSYDGEHIITGVAAGSYTIDRLDFVATATGDLDGGGSTLTETATTLVDGDTIQIDTTLETNYDGGFIVFNVLTNSFEISHIFTGTETGTWDSSGIDQTNPQVLTFATIANEDSHYIATAFVNDNATITPAITNNVFQDMEFGTLIQASTAERFKLLDLQTGVFQYTGIEDFDGFITFDFTSISSGGSTDFRYKWLIDLGAGYVDLPDPVEVAASIGSSNSNVTKTFPLRMSTDDKIKPQVTRNSGSSGLTTLYATIYATQ